MGTPWVGLWLLFGCALPLGQSTSMVKLPYIREDDYGYPPLDGSGASGDFEMSAWDSGEHAELSARMQQDSLRKAAALEAMAVPEYLRDKALNHYNQRGRGRFYTRLENSDLKIKKAFGVMVYVTMVLAKTNCVQDEDQDTSVEYTGSRLEEMGCQLLPESEQEQQECTFDIFLDARSGKLAVVTQRCTMLESLEQDHSSTVESY